MAISQYQESKDELIVIVGSVMEFILYEFIQIKLPIGTFDRKDIVGTIMGLRTAEIRILYENKLDMYIDEIVYEYNN